MTGHTERHSPGEYDPENADKINYCPQCGAKVERKLLFGRLRPTCPACGWIYFADPKVAAAVLVERDQRILLVRRINQPFRGQWSLPAGFINAGEDPVETARRECLEETGLLVRVTGLLDIISGREHRNGADFVIFYRAEVVDGELQAGDDADAVEWFARDDLPPLAFPSTQAILDRY